MKWTGFLHGDTSLEKLSVSLIIFGWLCSNGKGLLDHGTLKSGVSHTWFDKLSILIEWFLHFCMLIVTE